MNYFRNILNNLTNFIKITIGVIIIYNISYRFEKFSPLGFGNVWNKIQDFKSTASCISNSYKLFSLLNLLCNTTQTSSIQNRDACYGCFFRAGNLPGGQIQLQMLSQCSNLYLQGTVYATCTPLLQVQAVPANISVPLTDPTLNLQCTGYCSFVRCIRRINSNSLIDNCFSENFIRLNSGVRQSRIEFYTSITSCILAVTRCSQYNPISGQLQNPINNLNSYFGQTIINGNNNQQLGINGIQQQIPIQTNQYNSLQISSNGDIRIIYFPSKTIVNDLFCSRYTTLEQSSYKNYIC